MILSVRLTALIWIAILAPSALAHTPSRDELRLLQRSLSKPVIDNNFYDTTLDPSLRTLLPNTSYSISTWDNDLIPADCKSLVESQNLYDIPLSANDVEVFNVTYTDCDEPWVMCRHKDALGTNDDMAETFSQLPVRMRSYLRHLIAIPGVASAFSTGQNTVLVAGTIRSLTVYGHEVGHSLDGHAYTDFPNGFSGSSTWIDAYNADTAVCEAYAQTSQQENLAQMTNVALYDQNSADGIGKLCDNWREFGHMLQAMEANIDDTLKVGGTCQNRLVTSDPVPKVDQLGGTTLSNGDVVLTSIPAVGGSTAVATAATTTALPTAPIEPTFAFTPLATAKATTGAAVPGVSLRSVREQLGSLAAVLLFL